MYGLEYHRKKQHMSRPMLAKRSGVCVQLIMGLENKMMPGTAAWVYIALADALGIPLRELRAEMPDDDIRIPRESRSDNPDNPLSVYRRRNGLTQKQLAQLLGYTTCECGRIACARDIPRTKHLKTIAAHEGLTVDDFKCKYNNKSED